MKYYTSSLVNKLPKKADYEAIEYIKEQIYDVTTDDYICECSKEVCAVIDECLCKLDKLMEKALKRTGEIA